MNRNQIALIRETYGAVEDDIQGVVQDFYFRLFMRAPDVRELFSDDISVQIDKLSRMLALAVAALDDLGALEQPLMTLGAQHAGLGAEPAHYQLVAEILVDSIAVAAAPNCGEDHRAAWRALLDHVSALMIAGADAASAAA